MSACPPYLASLNACHGIYADFIARIPDIPVSTDKWETISKLKPIHDRHIADAGFDASEIWLAEQVHGNEIGFVPTATTDSSRIIPHVDGLICSGKAPCILGIYVADCAAIWLYDTITGAMALLHSGKKGTEGNISLRALQLMNERFDTAPDNVLAVISPCVRPPFYEIDIASLIREQLLSSGVKQENLTDSCLNTGADIHTFYSYRVEKGSTGRMLALMGVRK